MMPVVRLSETTWERLKRNARPLEDSVDDVVCRALNALEQSNGAPPIAPSARPTLVKRKRGEKLPQKEFRKPLLKLLLELGGVAPVATIRENLEPRMAPRLGEADYVIVSSGEPRWWNAVCWERADLVREGLFKHPSQRGVWALTDEGTLAARR